MCGICGKLVFKGGRPLEASLVGSMLGTIQHRGPDDCGLYLSSHVALGHRRLSIIDLDRGHQPLSNEDQSIIIVFNGEIYNYQELRNDLLSLGHTFKTHSDTEVILHLYEQYGEACLQKLRGMFAFAVWNERKRILFLARDRVGIKPLYYWRSADGLTFGSEIKAILADPAVKWKLNASVIDRFLAFFFVPGEETLFGGVQKLPPGHYLLAQDGQVQVRQYWNLEFSEEPISEREARAKTIELLDEVVRLHMISDVPVGFLLSGGVDSTALLRFAVGKSAFPLSSYTLGFSENVIADERPYAKLAAEQYGSEHHEMTISFRDFADFLPKYVWYMEEPVCEPQAVALYYVSKMAREYVKVLISGEGGDEAFAGYPIYRNILWLERLKRLLSPFNGTLRSGLQFVNGFAPTQKVGKYSPLLNVPFESYYYSRTFSPAGFFNNEVENLYTADFLAHINREQSLSPATTYLGQTKGKNVVNRMLYTDFKTSLPDDLLLKADKMTMANSLELRVPFLDHKLLEFAASLPAHYKVRRFTTKYVAKKALRGLLPHEILERRKAGFPVPYESWLRNEMNFLVRDILLDRKCVSRGYFRRDGLEKLLTANAASGHFPKEVLSLLTLELWHQVFVDSNGMRRNAIRSGEFLDEGATNACSI